MKILIVGSGAREHAIGEKISHSENCDELYFAPGNGGTSLIGKNVDIQADDLEKLVDFAKEEKIDFTIAGPEDPLCLGIVDKFEENDLKIFGPTKDAAQLENSKAFAKEFMVRHNIPTGGYLKAEDYDTALKFTKLLLENNGKAVIKADGLCAGKGVFIVNNEEEAKKHLEDIFVKGNYGIKKVVIEEFLDGFEMSLIAFVDNNTIKMLPTSRDHKNIYDGNLGPNTGGMGTYSPNLEAIPYLEDIEREVLDPFLKGINEDELDFRGIIFIGLMIGDKGIKVLEFNVRFGDPETQSIINKIDGDLLDIMIKTSEEKLEEADLKINDKKVVTLVLASGGYPTNYEKGYEITGLDDVENVKVYHAGTKDEDGKILTNGGRVISIVGISDDFEESIDKVYKAAQKINFKDMYYRKDIGPKVLRYYTEKKPEYFDNNKKLEEEIENELNIETGEIRLLDRFDIEGISVDEGEYIKDKLIGDPLLENIYYREEAYNLQKTLKNPLVVEYQKGQFSDTEYGIEKNLELYTKRDNINVKNSLVYSFENELSDRDKEKIREFIINHTNQEQGSLLGVPTTLDLNKKPTDKNPIYEGFRELDDEGLKIFLEEKNLSMSLEDLKFVQNYYKDLDRDINETELYILDTYWSDHCRHTTFNTILDIEFDDPETVLDERIYKEFEDYINTRNELDRKKPITLMDLGTIVSKYLTKTGDLDNQEKSDEVNACSIEVDVKVEDIETKEINTEKYLLMFKNETHNHPTEIEPFGGANTCLGGGIRDPLSGRAYVYQAMRLTGAGNPKTPYKDTLKGKLPQKRIAIESSDGYSKYGNEIGVAGGLVDEFYHDGFLAKRMELGALVGAQKKENVIREDSEPGDVILLLGAKTGRDGVGAASGSSTQQTEDLIEESSPEVQRGNPPLEKNIVRLFRNPEATKLIKKSNDFGAGGVSVAIGELADSLDIYLDRVPLKYSGLTPKEIAISESQERMAVVISEENKDKFIELAKEENIEITEAAKVTDTGKMIMYYKDKKVCELDREFLDTAGADRSQKVKVPTGEKTYYFSHRGSDLDNLYENLNDLNYVSKKNLIEKFDSTVGRGTVIPPLSGTNQITPNQSMVALIPTREGISKTASIMSYGYDPFLSEENQFLGGYYAVIDSLSKISAAGGNPLKARLSFQEFFESLGEDKRTWSKPLKSLLGAFYATKGMKVPPIGGKDSMSGTFNDIKVPPTLISFAVVSEDIENIISPELKGSGKLGIIETEIKEDYTLNHENLMENYKNIYEGIKNKDIKSVYAINYKGMAHNLMEMALGSEIGFNVEYDKPFDILPGSFILEYENPIEGLVPIGLTGGDTYMLNGEKIDKDKFKLKYLNGLNDIYPSEEVLEKRYSENKIMNSKIDSLEDTFEDVKVLLPIFPGTTGEYDIEEVVKLSGGIFDKVIFKDLTIDSMEKSIDEFVEKLSDSQILIIPSGLEYGDEPNGSGKLIGNFLREKKIKEAIESFLEKDRLILGIGSGFNGLMRVGLLPFGEYIDENLVISGKNISDKFTSRIIKTRYLTNNSPWLRYVEKDKIYNTPVATAYGRIFLEENIYEDLINNEQIASVFEENIFGSDYSIEGLLSPDGKILGKITNFDRIKDNTLISGPEIIDPEIIKSGIDYFKGN